MITTNIPALQIHKLTKQQYDAAKSAGSIDNNALYLTPATKEGVVGITVPAPRLRGDINGDGVIDDADVQMLTMHVASISRIPDDAGKLAADINKDGHINSDDTTALARYVDGLDSVLTDDDYAVNVWSYDSNTKEYYTDVIVDDILSTSNVIVAVETEIPVGTMLRAECINGYLRLFSSTVPSKDLNAVIVYTEGDGKISVVRNTTISLDHLAEITYVDDSLATAVTDLQTEIVQAVENINYDHLATIKYVDDGLATTATNMSAEITQALTGNAGSATKLATARSFITDLTSTSATSFDGTSNATLGVTGVLPISMGGTGATDADSAISNLGIDMICKTFAVTIPVSSWTLDSTTGFYKATVANTYITSEHVVNLNLDIVSLAVAEDCGLKSVTESYAGGFYLYAGSIPSDDMNGTLILHKGM